MRRVIGTLTAAMGMAAMGMAAGAAAAAPAVPPAGVEGTWINPHRSVAVRTGPCGPRLCGWIVWASMAAQADARDGGVQRLLGTALLEDYTAYAPHAWKGTVFVPDMNRRFSSRINQVSPDQLVVKGCILGGLICKSQTWSRIGQLPHG